MYITFFHGLQLVPREAAVYFFHTLMLSVRELLKSDNF